MEKTSKIIASTLIKVDNDVNLKKCNTIKVRVVKTKAGKNDNPDKEPHPKKTKVEKVKSKKIMSEEKGEATVKVVPNRNPFNVGDLVMSTAKQIAHPAYEFHYISPSYLFLDRLKIL